MGIIFYFLFIKFIFFYNFETLFRYIFLDLPPSKFYFIIILFFYWILFRYIFQYINLDIYLPLVTF